LLISMYNTEACSCISSFTISESQPQCCMHPQYPSHHALAVSRSIITGIRSELVQCVECEVWRVRCEDPYSRFEIAVSSIGKAMGKQVV
jgi:hypothetical protein